ncbi:ribonuclease H-like domain-containing protein [Hypoxylon cercidicola]|nr:ribonuclease H-like domain-containing protein [Hypoxylon cercidicola]
MEDGIWKPTASFNKDVPQWPLSYSITNPPMGQEWWNHIYYRGPDNQAIEILYSDSSALSESIAQTFLKEPVLGFDMEWPMDADTRTRLQEKVALIQIACESRIALFHIALHDGKTSEEIIAPSLRRIIESPAILKVGVAILSADFKRLKENFGLQPRGAFELSHLHSLVCYGSRGQKFVTTRLWKLADQVRLHLGLPLQKDAVRQSDWSKPLNEEQRTYAANDAYAGYMLFHCMNAKRLKMIPVLPLPKLAESYLPFDWGSIRPVQFEPTQDVSPSIPVIGTEYIFGKTSVLRYQKLLSLRKSASIAKNVSYPAVVSNVALMRLSRDGSISKIKLLETYGVGEREAKLFGDEWLQVIESFETRRESGSSQTSVSNAPTEPFFVRNDRNSKRRRLANLGHSKEAHLERPSESTGLSFQLADNQLDANEAPVERGDGND